MDPSAPFALSLSLFSLIHFSILSAGYWRSFSTVLKSNMVSMQGHDTYCWKTVRTNLTSPCVFVHLSPFFFVHAILLHLPSLFLSSFIFIYAKINRCHLAPSTFTPRCGLLSWIHIFSTLFSIMVCFISVFGFAQFSLFPPFLSSFLVQSLCIYI